MATISALMAISGVSVPLLGIIGFLIMPVFSIAVFTYFLVPSARKRKSLIMGVLGTLALLFLIMTLVIIKTFLFNVYVVKGNSMSPVISDGDTIIISKIVKPKPEDVVVFKFPEDINRFHVQRVIGVPGEELVFDGWYVNVANRDAKYRLSDSRENAGDRYTIFLEDNEYYVLGDNFEASHTYESPIHKIFIEGVVIFGEAK